MLGRILVFLGGLLVLILFAALIVPYFVDWSDFRRNFETQASRVLGKKVEVAGDVQVRFLPFPSVTMHDVRVGSDANGKPLATAAQFSMDAELAPFLSGEARIFKMELDQPEINLHLKADGTLDWLKTGQSDLAARNVVFEDVEVRNGTVRLSDDATGHSRVISDITAKLSSTAIDGPWHMDGTAALDGYSGTFTIQTGRPDPATGQMRLRASLVPDAWPVSADLEGDVALDDGKPAYRGDFRLRVETGDDADPDSPPPPRASGKFELTNASLALPSYRLEIGSRTDPYVIEGEGNFDTSPGGAFLLTANGQQFDVERLSTGSASNGKSARVTGTSARKRLDSLISFLRGIPIPQVPGKVVFQLPAVVAGDTTIRSVQLEAHPDGDGWQIEKGIAILPGRTQVEASGRLTLGDNDNTAFRGNLLVASQQPTGLANWLTGNVAPEIRQITRAGFSADVVLTRNSQKFDNLEIIAGDASLKGSADREAPEGQVPKLSLTLSGNVIDYSTLSALTGLAVGSDVKSGLAAHAITAKLNADTLNAFGVSANGVSADFAVQAGSVTVNRFDAQDIAGARVEISGQAQSGVGGNDGLSGSGRVHIAAADPSAFLALLDKRLPSHPLTGMLEDHAVWYQDTDLTADLVFGRDGQDLSALLSGTVNGGKLNGSWRLKTLGQLAGMTGQIQVSNPDAAVIFGQAGFDPLPLPAPAGAQLSLNVDNVADDGKGDVTFRLASGDTSLGGKGRVAFDAADFLDGTMSLTLKSPDLEPYLAMNTLVVPGTGLGLPVNLSGTLDVTRDSFALSALSGSLAGNAVSGRLALARHQPVARVSGALSVDQLDLDWLLETVFGPDAADTSAGVSDAPIGKAYFGTGEADIDLQAASFDPGLLEPVTGLSTKVHFRGGGLELDDISGAWLGGTVSGALRLGNNDGSGYVQTQLNVKNGALADHAWRSDGKPVIDGRFDLGLVCETTGGSLKALVEKASGSGMLTLKNPTVNGLDLDIGTQLLSWATDQGTEIKNAAVPAAVSASLFGDASVQLGKVDIPFSLSGGVLQARNVIVDLPIAQLYGSLSLDLREQTIDAALQTTLKLGEDEDNGASPDFALNFTGPLAAPAVSLDTTDLNNFLSLRAVERERRRVERLQADVLEKQRLRREAALYQYNDDQRRKAEEAKKAAEEAARKAAEEAAAAAANADGKNGSAAAGEPPAAGDANPPAAGKAAQNTQTAPEQPASN
ncbi:AsmA family protein [Martelella sp. HB161492]|uniref:AsmA family protein n=1 Tax=Martelella sp. HB161492 TaxID=2720726 RepID=UPI001592787C